ncbi:OLC1v1029214C1 [Oldenlandia corymbosa var. corymbosa]|uniref:OLC1v1029214C1 n=1 Tax=Oldenlandia corymbosa var. corymbosa TaxID=529605 RepID=A0AAV1CDG9_OLDCO|nr:OLC1v1029214C1 [Oldenlandia corymbosa var. corymbosa]
MNEPNAYDWIVSSNRGNQMVCGFSGPSIGQGSNYNVQPSYIHDADSYALRNLHQPERESVPVGAFSYDASYPAASNIHHVHQDSYMESMPISATSIATLLAARFDNHENPEQCASSAAPFLYPLETFNPSFPQNNIRYDGSLLSEADCNWASSNFAAHEELAGIVGSRNQQPGFFDTSSGSSSRLSNELSLSLATSNNHMVLRRASIQDQSSEICCSGSPYERCIGSEQTSSSRNLGLSFGSNRTIQLSQLISGSKYTRVMQEILAELAAFSLGNLDLTSTEIGGRSNLSFASSCNAEKGYPESDSDYFPDDASWRVMNQVDCPVNQIREVEKKKKQLLDLLQVVDDRYNECLDEIHTVVSAFHTVTELDPPIHARFFLQTISLLYKNLRERISSYILSMGAYSSEGVMRKDENSFEATFIQKQWALQQLKRKDNQLWRPQRGLPEKSVSVLRAWLFQNFLHPYPKDAEKHLLAVKSGLTRSQVELEV